MRTFEIRGSLPADGTPARQWRNNKSCIVVADDIHAAIALVVKEYPGIVIFDVVHRGGVDIIQSPTKDTST